MSCPTLTEPAAPSRPASAGAIASPREAPEGPPLPVVLLDWLGQRGPDVLHRLPDASRLETQLADLHGVSAARVLVTADAEDALTRVARLALWRGGRVAITEPAPDTHLRALRLAGAEAVATPWLAGEFPGRAMAGRLDGRTGAIFVASPNDPTGQAAALADLAELRRSSGRPLLAVDLSQVEYAGEDPTRGLLDLPDTVVVRSLSHAWGLGGLGVGYVLGPAELVAQLRALGPAAPVAGPSLTVAEDWLSAGAHRVQQGVRRVRQERAALAALLESLGARPLRSQGSFVLAWFADAGRVAAGLAERGIAVRAFAPEGPLGEFLRLACPGEAEGYARLDAALREAAAQAA